MKKIIFLIVVLVVPFVCYADDNVTYSFRNNHYLCKDNKIYQSINAFINNRYLYSMGRFDTFYSNRYKKLDYDMPDAVTNILAYEFVAKKYVSGSTLYSVMNKLLADTLNIETYLCDGEDYSGRNDEKYYLKVKAEIDKIEKGPLNNIEYNLNSGEVLKEETDILKYYEIVSTDNLLVELTDNNINISGDDGSYDLVFKKKSNNYDEQLVYGYDDQVLVTASDFPYKEYHYKITIGNESKKENVENNNNDNDNKKELLDIIQNKKETYDSLEIEQNNTENKKETYDSLEIKQNNIENPETSDKITSKIVYLTLFTLFLTKIKKIKRKLMI